MKIYRDTITYRQSGCNYRGQAVQILRPAADNSTGGWIVSPLFSKVNEAYPNDSTLISSNDKSVCELALDAAAVPFARINHVVRYRFQKEAVNSGTANLKVSLYEGSTLIAEQSHLNVLNGWTLGELTLTTNQASAISNYANLRLRFTTF